MILKAHMILKETFGYHGFRPLQEEIILSVLGKRDTFVLIPTGGGKSICYQIPALSFDGLTVVVSPLISLMKDQIDQLHSIKYPAEALNSTVPFGRQAVIKELAENAQLKLLYLTPERFKNERFTEWLESIKVSCFVVD